LVIVGEGPAKDELVQLASDLELNEHVQIAGSVPHADLYLWYSAADVFCLASSREGWPNVLLESLACGTPVVAANIWGVPEVIRTEQVGILTGREEKEIAGGIASALKRPWASEVIVQFAKQHTWERAASSVLKIFEAVLKRNDLTSDRGESSPATVHPIRGI
jgi:glycosyltransferase involved in cell wall biosynthesis